MYNDINNNIKNKNNNKESLYGRSSHLDPLTELELNHAVDPVKSNPINISSKQYEPNLTQSNLTHHNLISSCRGLLIDKDTGKIFVHRFCACYSSLLYPVYLNLYVTNLSGQQRDLQLYVESKPHRGLKFYHQKYNPLTPWWNEWETNPCLSGREQAPNPLSHERSSVRSGSYSLVDINPFSVSPLLYFCVLERQAFFKKLSLNCASDQSVYVSS